MSILKPRKPRQPLQVVNLGYDDEEDTTEIRRKRVSFTGVKKIREFNSSAESVVICNIPDYEEEFTSSDSSQIIRSLSSPFHLQNQTPEKELQETSDMELSCVGTTETVQPIYRASQNKFNLQSEDFNYIRSTGGYFADCGYNRGGNANMSGDAMNITGVASLKESPVKLPQHHVPSVKMSLDYSILPGVSSRSFESINKSAGEQELFHRSMDADMEMTTQYINKENLISERFDCPDLAKLDKSSSNIQLHSNLINNSRLANDYKLNHNNINKCDNHLSVPMNLRNFIVTDTSKNAHSPVRKKCRLSQMLDSEMEETQVNTSISLRNKFIANNNYSCISEERDSGTNMNLTSDICPALHSPDVKGDDWPISSNNDNLRSISMDCSLNQMPILEKSSGYIPQSNYQAPKIEFQTSVRLTHPDVSDQKLSLLSENEGLGSANVSMTCVVGTETQNFQHCISRNDISLVSTVPVHNDSEPLCESINLSNIIAEQINYNVNKQENPGNTNSAKNSDKSMWPSPLISIGNNSDNKPSVVNPEFSFNEKSKVVTTTTKIHENISTTSDMFNSSNKGSFLSDSLFVNKNDNKRKLDDMDRNEGIISSQIRVDQGFLGSQVQCHSQHKTAKTTTDTENSPAIQSSNFRQLSDIKYSSKSDPQVDGAQCKPFEDSNNQELSNHPQELFTDLLGAKNKETEKPTQQHSPNKKTVLNGKIENDNRSCSQESNNVDTFEGQQTIFKQCSQIQMPQVNANERRNDPEKQFSHKPTNNSTEVNISQIDPVKRINDCSGFSSEIPPPDSATFPEHVTEPNLCENVTKSGNNRSSVLPLESANSSKQSSQVHISVEELKNPGKCSQVQICDSAFPLQEGKVKTPEEDVEELNNSKQLFLNNSCAQPSDESICPIKLKDSSRRLSQAHSNLITDEDHTSLIEFNKDNTPEALFPNVPRSQADSNELDLHKGEEEKYLDMYHPEVLRESCDKEIKNCTGQIPIEVVDSHEPLVSDTSSSDTFDIPNTEQVNVSKTEQYSVSMDVENSSYCPLIEEFNRPEEDEIQEQRSYVDVDENIENKPRLVIGESYSSEYQEYSNLDVQKEAVLNSSVPDNVYPNTSTANPSVNVPLTNDAFDDKINFCQRNVSEQTELHSKAPICENKTDSVNIIDNLNSTQTVDTINNAVSIISSQSVKQVLGDFVVPQTIMSVSEDTENQMQVDVNEGRIDIIEKPENTLSDHKIPGDILSSMHRYNKHFMEDLGYHYYERTEWTKQFFNRSIILHVKVPWVQFNLQTPIVEFSLKSVENTKNKALQFCAPEIVKSVKKLKTFKKFKSLGDSHELFNEISNLVSDIYPFFESLQKLLIYKPSEIINERLVIYLASIKSNIAGQVLINLATWKSLSQKDITVITHVGKISSSFVRELFFCIPACKERFYEFACALERMSDK